MREVRDEIAVMLVIADGPVLVVLYLLARWWFG